MKLKNKSIYKKYFSWAVLGLSLVFLSSCSDKKAEETMANTTQAKTISYETEPISLIQAKYEISLPGEIEPNEEVALFAKINGFVQKLYVDIGDEVKKGQILAKLEAPELNQTYLSMQSKEQKSLSDYEYAKQNYERLLQASKTKGAVAALELERAKSAMTSAESAHKSSKAQTNHSQQIQDYLSIRAPFDGIISERNLSEGALVGPGSGQAIFSLVQTSSLKLNVSVPERHAAAIPDSLEVEFTVNSQPHKSFKAKLSRSSHIIHRTDRALNLEFEIPNEDKELNGGEYAQVKMNLGRKSPSFWVNARSIQETQAGSFVWKLASNELYKTPVKQGLRLDVKIEVFGDFSEGDEIVLKPGDQMKEGPIQ